jgi:2-succinyl-6-hydroxy-2,4-cyclohexadiene-1-carboxylate synthase
MPYLQVRGHDHYYEWVNQAPRSPESCKPVMVFLHGWGGSGCYWQPIAQALIAEFDCLLYDLRGFGRSHDPVHAVTDIEAYQLQSYVEDLATLLEMLSLTQVCLHAHSMGATIATLFTNQYPHRVQQLILTCSGLFTYDQQAFQRFHQVSRWLVRSRPQWLSQVPLLDRLLMARFLHQSIAQEQRRAFVKDYLTADTTAALGTLLSAVSEAVATAMSVELARLTMPTLLISGEQDQIVSAQSGRQAAALNPKIEYRVIEQTGHFPMLEDPPTYLEQVQRFLSSVPC